jgi:flagellin-like protein
MSEFIQRLAPDDERSVAPVISVILMVAITVILAAVIGVFVLGLGEDLEAEAPQSTFEFEYNAQTGNVTVSHTNGDPVNGDQLRFAGAALEQTSLGNISEWADSEVTSGDSATVNVKGGEELRLIWESDDEQGTSAILGRYDVPESAGAGGTISLLSAQSVNDETKVSVGSLSQTGGNAHLVVSASPGGSATMSVSANTEETLSLPVDPGSSVTVTVYETSNENNELDAVTGSPVEDASIGNLNPNGTNTDDTRVDGAIEVENLRFNGTSSDSVFLNATDESANGKTYATETVSGSEWGNDIEISGMDDGQIGDEQITVTVYESSSETNQLAQATANSDPDNDGTS